MEMLYKEFIENYLFHKRVVQIESSCRLEQDGMIIPNGDRFSQKEEYISDKLLHMTELSAELYICKLCELKFYSSFNEEIKEHWDEYHHKEKVLTIEGDSLDGLIKEQKLEHINTLFENDKEITQITIKGKEEEFQIYRCSFFNHFINIK